MATVRTRMLARAAKAYRVTTRLRYRSGKPHGALDIAAPTGTPVYAPFPGRVVAARDGVPNNKPGARIWSGKPSNWVLLEVNLKTNYGTRQPATILFQHLSPGLTVKAGDRVVKGELLGHTGNTGNSTGPHLHLGGQWVPRGQKAHLMQRYDHVTSAKRRVWPPERLLG